MKNRAEPGWTVAAAAARDCLRARASTKPAWKPSPKISSDFVESLVASGVVDGRVPRSGIIVSVVADRIKRRVAAGERRGDGEARIASIDGGAGRAGVDVD